MILVHTSIARRRRGLITSLIRGSLAGLLCIMAQSGISQTGLLQPSKGVYVALADTGFWNHEDYATTSQSTLAHHAKKLLNLSGLSEQTWSEVRAAEASIFMYVQDDRGDGLNERFEIIV